MDTITDAEIRALKTEADEHDDTAQCILCLHALNGEGPLNGYDWCDWARLSQADQARLQGMSPEQARAECERAIRDAQASASE